MLIPNNFLKLYFLRLGYHPIISFASFQKSMSIFHSEKNVALKEEIR